MRRERRQHLTIGTQPPPATEIWEDMKFRILHANIRGWISHAAELTARVRLMDEKPDLICVNETFLNRTVEHIELEGYSLVARRDRGDGRQGGGIAAFASTGIAERVTLIQSSDDAERFWLMVHADQGPHLVGVWYRPPAPGEVATVTTLKTEFAALEGMSLGSIVLGDINVHNRQWLKHSSHNSAEGIALRDACGNMGLQQKVTKPTREEHLLDLVLTNLPGAKAQTMPSIADHKLVMAELPFKAPEHVAIPRTVWQYAKADWERMRSVLEESEWDCMNAMGPDEASGYLSKTILDAAELCIPRKTFFDKKSTHPWLTDEVEDLVEAKRTAEGTPSEREAAEACSAGILSSFVEFTKTCADKLRQLLPGSKGWWSKSRQLMDNKPKVSSIPALKAADGEWIFDPKGKANAFSEKFAGKYKLIPLETNEYTEVSVSTQKQTCGPMPSEDQGVGDVEGGQRNWPGHAANTDPPRMCLPNREAFPHISDIDLAIPDMATSMDDALGCATFQERGDLPSWELQGHPLNATDFQGHGTVSGFDGGQLHVVARMRWPEPVCIPKGPGGQGRVGLHVADLAFWIQRQVKIQHLLFGCVWRF